MAISKCSIIERCDDALCRRPNEQKTSIGPFKQRLRKRQAGKPIEPPQARSNGPE